MSTKFDLIDIKALRGDTETYTYSVTNGGVAYNLSGYTIVATFRRSWETEVITTISFTDGAGGNVYSTGTIVMTIPATTSKILPEVCVYDIQATNAGTTLTIARGQLRVFPECT